MSSIGPISLQALRRRFGEQDSSSANTMISYLLFSVVSWLLSLAVSRSYFAAPGVHLGTLYEVDIGTYRRPAAEANEFEVANGGVAVATYAPPKPTLTLEPQLPNQDVYEVRIYDSRRNRQLVAAIEIVSPSNKDRPGNRATFIAKVATLLKTTSACQSSMS